MFGASGFHHRAFAIWESEFSGLKGASSFKLKSLESTPRSVQPMI